MLRKNLSTEHTEGTDFFGELDGIYTECFLVARAQEIFEGNLY